MSDLTNYEQLALHAIDKFKNPERTWLGNAWNTVTKPVGALADVAFDNSVGAAVTKAIQGVMELLNDGASWTVRTDAILGEFRKDGHSVATLQDIHALPLENVDKTVGLLAAKYKSTAFAEGAAAGALGIIGIAVDIPLLVGMALRAVNEYASYYGFDVSVQGERMFAMSILSAASAPNQAAKQVALAELTRLSVMIAKRKTWEELQRLVSVQVIKKIAQALGIRLTKGKLAQLVPVLGAAVGAGYNAWYLSQVTETAYLLYRERFLIEKHGPDIAITVRE